MWRFRNLSPWHACIDAGRTARWLPWWLGDCMESRVWYLVEKLGEVLKLMIREEGERPRLRFKLPEVRVVLLGIVSLNL